jgi:hypothetical protein
MDTKYTVVQSSGARNFYWVSIVRTISLLHTSPDHPRPQKTKKQKQKQTVSCADKKIRWVVKYSAVYVESKNTFRFALSSGCRNGKPMDCKYLWSVTEVSERNRRDWTGPQCGIHP